MAPEVLNDLPYDCKADVYSAGIILYILLSGKLPFNGASYKDIVYKNMRGKINFKVFEDKNISGDTLNFLKKVLEVN